LIALAIVTTALGAPGEPSAAQTSAGELASAPLTHIGVVVPDMDAAVRQYVRVMGFAPPKVDTVPVPMPDGQNAEIKLATLLMPNFFIELTEPVNHVGPYYEHLRTHGMSIMHVGVALAFLTGNVDDLRGAGEQQGGRWNLGAKGGKFAYLDFRATLGAMIEMNRGGVDLSGHSVPPPTGDALPRLATLAVTHVGSAVTDASVAANGYAKLLGITPPKVIDYKDSQYPPNAKWNNSAYVRLATWKQGAIGVELIESVGAPTPWSEFVAHHKGPSVQHIALNAGNWMDELIRDLLSKGGKWTNGKPGGNYAYLDFTDTLGLIFELNGTSKSNRVN
jgi:hypothetical protein